MLPFVVNHARQRQVVAAFCAAKVFARRIDRDLAALGLIFAREDVDLQTATSALGTPIDTLSEARFRALIKACGVRKIKFHGCRHTVATLSLQAGTPPHVVAARLGHSVVELLTTYAHAMPDSQADAAARLGALLHG